MRLLIVTADDLGLHESMNRGALEAFRKGIVKGCSVVANGRAFEHAVDLLRGEPACETGVHLTFVEEVPILPAARVRSLVGSDGRFHRNFRSFAARYFAGLIDLTELAQELRAQLQQVSASGLDLHFLNSHQHLHALPAIFHLVEELAVEAGVGYVRLPTDLSQGKATPLRRLSIAVLSHFSARSSLDRLTESAEGTLGVTGAGHLSAEDLLALLRFSGGSAELVVHPGDDDGALAQSYDWKYEWEKELRALCDPRVAAAIAASDVRIVGVNEFLQLQAGSS